MKVLFISSQLLHSGTRFGGAKRLYNYAKALQDRHELHVLCLDGAGEPEALLRPPPPEFRRYLRLPHENRKGPFPGFFQLPIALKTWLAEHRKRIAAFLDEHQYDAVFLAYPQALAFLSILPKHNLRNVTYLEDDSYLEALRLRIGQGADPLRRWFRRLQCYQARAYYRKSFRHIARAVAISTQESELLAEFLPRERIHIVGYGIRLQDYPFQLESPASVFGFIGNYRHLPNTDAVAYLMQVLIPEWEKRKAEFRFILVGPGISSLFAKQGFHHERVEIIEDLADLGDFYRKISIFINPIISGKGMRTKLIEAAAYGKPIVSTSLGAEGAFGLRISLADDPKAFVDSCLALAGNSIRHAEEARENRLVVEKEYSIESVVGRLESILIGRPETK